MLIYLVLVCLTRTGIASTVLYKMIEKLVSNSFVLELKNWCDLKQATIALKAA
jgi:hypothetical protein